MVSTAKVRTAASRLRPRALARMATTTAEAAGQSSQPEPVIASTASRAAARPAQAQTPYWSWNWMMSVKGRLLASAGRGRRNGRAAPAAAAPPTAAAGLRRDRRLLGLGGLHQLGDAGDGAHQRAHLGRHDDGLLLRALGQLAERLHVLLCDEVVDRVDVALGDGGGDQLGGLGLGLGRALARLGVAE